MPQRVGRYVIVGRLGAGGMGVVYRGHDPQLRRDVAIKLPTFRGLADACAIAQRRFLREARAAAAVRHPHICPIHDVGEDQGHPYVVMALIEGGTLSERLRRDGRFADCRHAVQLTVQIADALAAVHALGVTHRDLKPGNILIERDGQAYLTDFGLARDDHDPERLTDNGALLGTPAYMAPEQASDELEVGLSCCRAGTALAIVLYPDADGARPAVSRHGAVNSIQQISMKTPPPPSQHRPDLDPELERLLLKAMTRQPHERFASVADFASALRGWEARQTATLTPADLDTAKAPPPSLVHWRRHSRRGGVPLRLPSRAARWHCWQAAPCFSCQRRAARCVSRSTMTASRRS